MIVTKITHVLLYLRYIIHNLKEKSDNQEISYQSSYKRNISLIPFLITYWDTLYVNKFSDRSLGV